MKIRMKTASAAVLLALGCATAQAAYVVDTGTPGGLNLWALYPDQSLGATFSLGAATVVTAIEGYIDPSGGGGTVNVDLYSGGVPGGVPMFLTSGLVSGLESWKVFGGLNWALAAGTYTVAFSTASDFSMRNGAPSALNPEWFTGSGDWYQYDDTDIGVRVAAIPEPETYALMAAGLALVAGMARRRRSGVA